MLQERKVRLNRLFEEETMTKIIVATAILLLFFLTFREVFSQKVTIGIMPAKVKCDFQNANTCKIPVTFMNTYGDVDAYYWLEPSPNITLFKCEPFSCKDILVKKNATNSTNIYINKSVNGNQCIYVYARPYNASIKNDSMVNLVYRVCFVVEVVNGKTYVPPPSQNAQQQISQSQGQSQSQQQQSQPQPQKSDKISVEVKNPKQDFQNIITESGNSYVVNEENRVEKPLGFSLSLPIIAIIAVVAFIAIFIVIKILL